MRRCPVFERWLLFGFAVSCANGEAGAGPATQTAAGVVTRPVSITVVPAPWKEMPAWQNAPDGHGQYLLFPSQYAQFEIAQMQYAVTPLGVLVRELRLPGGQMSSSTPGPWKVVPELYLRQLELLGMHDGLLWVVENKPLQGRAVGGTQVLALDPTDWSMRRSLELPPGSRAVKVDDGGCWFLEGKKNIGGGARGPMGYGALVCRDFGDRETFRFAANTLTTSRPAVPGGSLAGMLQTVPAPLIYWWAVDADAVYLSVVDYRGIAPNDAPIYGGPSQFVRIDRNRGKQVALEAPILDYTTIANAPGQIFWVQPKYLSGGTVKNDIYQLDKQSMRISQVGTFEWRRIDALAVDRDYLWMRALAAAGEDRRTRAYSLKDFKEVPNAGTGPFEESVDRCASWLLAGDESRVWFASGSRVFEIVDNGESWVRDMSRVFSVWDLNWPSAAKFGVLYGGAWPRLFRVAAGSDEVILNEPPPGDRFYPQKLGVGGRYLWAAAGYDLVAFDESLTEVRRFSPQTNQIALAASGRVVYYFRMTNGVPTLMCGDAATGEQAQVESWNAYAEQSPTRTCNQGQSPAGGVQAPGSPIWMAADDAGRIHMLYNRRTSPNKNGFEWRLTLWSYDPAKDEWNDQDLPKHYEVLPFFMSPCLFYDTRQQALVTTVDGKWVPLGSLPKRWFDYRGAGFWRVHVTGKYLYAWTPLGLWRTPRTPKRGDD